ncbi:MAG: DUF5689 domain-containing protein [Flavobacteriales bacterium]|jgi:hypothetical protein|nr:DUF5689 domain-containing protein [Flavobacteriales bacterium]
MKRLSILLAAAGLMFGFASCEKEYDTPPIPEIPVGTIKTIAEVRAMYSGVDSVFTDDLTIRAVVTTDETTGNFYKETYIQDATGGIKLRFTSSSSLSIGDSIRVQLNGGTLTEYNGMLSVDNLDPDESNVILQNNVTVTPVVTTLAQVTGALQGQFIQLDNVEFSDSDLGTSWADPVNQFSVNHNLTDCDGNVVLVRTSGYANFAGDIIPNGNGTIYGVVGVFGNDVQIFIRNPQELTLSGVRCAGGGGGSCDPLAGVNEGFTGYTIGTEVNSNCWRSGVLQGSNKWLCGDNSGDLCAVATGNVSGTQEMWMATPLIQSAGNDMLSFSSAQQNILTSALQVYVSTDYDGNNYSSATWTPVTATVATGADANNTYVSSGSIALNTYLGAGYTGTYAVAFKATMANNSFSLFKVDNVMITQ